MCNVMNEFGIVIFVCIYYNELVNLVNFKRVYI